MEHDHRYIQWLFPLTTESEVVFAPRLREHKVRELRTDPVLQRVLIELLEQFLQFLGFEMHQANGAVHVLRSADFVDRSRVWLSPRNHNYRRLSRVLGSLTIAGLSDHARALLTALEDTVRRSEDGAIGATALRYWRRRAGMPTAADADAGW